MSNGFFVGYLLTYRTPYSLYTSIMSDCVYLKSPSFEQADLVVLRKLFKSWDAFGKLHNLPNSWSEAHGEVLPDCMA